VLTDEDVETIQHAFKEAREAKKRIAELEAALREIADVARKHNVDDGDGGDHLLLLIESTARDALQKSTGERL